MFDLVMLIAAGFFVLLLIGIAIRLLTFAVVGGTAVTWLAVLFGEGSFLSWSIAIVGSVVSLVLLGLTGLRRVEYY